MVKVIMGLKGSGKTKKLIDTMNTAIRDETGNMICIERGTKLTFDLDYRVRLIESSEYDLDSYEFLKGFISGLYAGNYDISHIFIDSLYKIVGSDDTAEVEAFLQWVEDFSKTNGVKFTITISADVESATEGIKKYL